MAYSVVGDLLLGDLMVPLTLDKVQFVEGAAEEMDSKLGFVYSLPLRIDPQPEPPPAQNDWTLLPLHQQLLLKNINNKLASGRIILTLDIAGEGTSLHAYGLRLVTEATNELMLIANGDVAFDAIRLAISGNVPDRAPKIINHDEESAVDIFESVAMRRDESGWWQPGTTAPVAGQ